jgi:hypothetical protein
MNYNYITAAGLDIGLALCSIFLFFFIQLPGLEMTSWWGTNVITSTLEQNGEAVRVVLPKGETFGPPAGSWKW